MLGVIFTGGASPEAEIIKLVLSGKQFFSVAADSGLIAAEEAGIKVDCIVGDMDSLGDESRLASYPPDCVIRHERDKDFSDTELAIKAAEEKGCDEIWIIGGGGGRIDHLFAIRSLFERDIFPSRWITDSADIYCIDAKSSKPALHAIVEKDSKVSVFPLGKSPWEAKSSGLKWRLAGLPWTRGFFGLSNTAPNGEFTVKAEKGRFMIILEFFPNLSSD